MVAIISTTSLPLPATAASYGSLTTEQKFIAEAWRTVDSTFLDRTFNGQDWFQLRETYVNKKYKNMADAQESVAEMISKLGDKYTRYLSPAKYQSMVDSATGILAGVGVEIATDKDGLVMVSDVEPNSPAQKAGLLPNDLFIEGDGLKFDKSSTPDDVALKLRGPVGSRVGVTVSRGGEIKDFIITREPIKVTSVRSYMGKGNVGVIRIKSFSGTTAELVKENYQELQKKGAKEIVFDLRSNPGGLLPGGIDTASLFLDANKPIVFVVSNKGVIDSQETYATGFDLETPLVLLVDHNTASAAEVFTAALKENGRAKVVGEQTFGKGIIQTIRELSDRNGGVAVTVARYETPQHNDINKSGIAVDMETKVDCPKDDALACIPPTVL
jgi:carboxyl-terminal processing protease